MPPRSKPRLAESDNKNDNKRDSECTDESSDWSSRADKQEIFAHERLNLAEQQSHGCDQERAKKDSRRHSAKARMEETRVVEVNERVEVRPEGYGVLIVKLPYR